MLEETAGKDGVPAAQQQYNDLRAKYYGSAAYDFSPRSLQDFAQWLAHDKKDLDGAIAIANMSIQRDPEVADNYSVLAMLQVRKGRQSGGDGKREEGARNRPAESPGPGHHEAVAAGAVGGLFQFGVNQFRLGGLHGIHDTH